MSDPTTQTNYLQAATTHVAFDWTVDFQKQIISGSATHTIEIKASGVKEVRWVVATLFPLLYSIEYPRNDVASTLQTLIFMEFRSMGLIPPYVLRWPRFLANERRTLVDLLILDSTN